MPPPRPAVFLDRDGVINRTTVRGDTPYPPNTVDEVEILPGVPEALRRLKAAGLPLIVVTNQPDVARGTQTRDAVGAINAELRRRLPIDAVLSCYHDDADDCRCRKPRPGLLIDAAERFHVDLRRGFLVGDRWRDTEAGRLAGCTTILLRRLYSGDRARADFEAADMAAAAEIIVRILRCREEQAGEDLRR